MPPRTIDFTQYTGLLKGIDKLKWKNPDSHHLGFRERAIQQFLMDKIPEDPWVQRWILNNSEMWLYHQPRWQLDCPPREDFPTEAAQHDGRILYVARKKAQQYIEETEYYVLLGEVDVE